jgi:hypothetical protein
MNDAFGNRVDQELMVEVILDAKQHLVELEQSMNRSVTDSERVSLAQAAADLRKVIRRHLS